MEEPIRLPSLPRERVITYTPLLYNDDTDFSTITNVLLVDTNVQDYNKFVENVNSSTFAITFSQGSKGQDIVDLLAAKLPSITRIAIVANDSMMASGKRLFSYKPYFESSDLEMDTTKTSYSENLQLLIDLIKAHSVQTIDFLACSSLTFDNWKAYYSILSKETGVTVGASNDQTGNILSGGDWTMESTGVDIEAIYFSSGISNYQGTLAGGSIDFDCKLYMNVANNVAYSRNNGVDKTNIDWPCTLSGNITVTLGENLILNNANNYFTIANSGSNDVTIDGANYTITVTNVNNYVGLVNSEDANTTVKNIGLLSSGNTRLASDSGWIGQENFIGTIDNCYSNGDIGIINGGIAGASAGYNGTCTITNCHSTGDISGDYSGGIAGGIPGGSGICTITNCYSTGAISGEFCGGIAGASAGGEGGTCNITNCYSTGAISGGGSGGIAGNEAGFDGGNCTITNCYSSGAISGGGSGGIAGEYAGAYVAGYCEISNCYSTGAISGDDSGGIAGNDAGADGGECSIRNCYTTGAIGGDNSGGIVGNSATATCTINHCYTTGTISGIGSGGIQPLGSSAVVANSEHSLNDWSDTNTLLKTDVWKPIFANSPWKLSSFLTSTIVTYSYNGSTLLYNSSLFPIVTYGSGVLSTPKIQLLYDGVAVGNPVSVNTTQRSITFNSVSGLDDGSPTTLRLLSNGSSYDYLNFLTISSPPTTTTTSTTTTSTTTLPPTQYSVVEFAINAPFSLINTPENKANYEVTLKAKVVDVTDAPPNTVTVIGVRSGSIINTVRLPTIYVQLLQNSIQSGAFEITINGVIYEAIPGSFVILDNICFQKGTMILTPNGYRAVESLNSGDLVKTAQGRITKVQSVTSFTGKVDKCPLYVLPKGILGTNKPIVDLYMSEGHAYCNNGKWCHMKCSSVTMKLDEDNVEYYNIVLDNYFEHTLVANGVEVESLFKVSGLVMTWNCKTDNCKPVIALK